MARKYLFLYVAFILLSVGCSDGKFRSVPDLQGAPLGVPTIDISSDTLRHSVIAKGSPSKRQAHPSSVLLKDGKTIIAVWTIGHGGACGEMAVSHNGGMDWEMVKDLPDNWSSHYNCPPLFLLPDPIAGTDRILTFAEGKNRHMCVASADAQGQDWTPFEECLCSDCTDTLLNNAMPFTTVIPVHGGRALLGASNIRSLYRGNGIGGDIIGQSYSYDGGHTWSSWRVVLDMDGTAAPCEPFIIRSPKGNQLMMIMRENNHAYNALAMTSDDEGATWSSPWRISPAVTFDRPEARYLSDGRLIVVGRDVSFMSPAHQHLTAWIGTYDDLLEGRDGQYRVKLLHSYHGSVEYPGIEVLPDGTVVVMTSLSYRPGENYSVVCTRFHPSETDLLYRRKCFMPDRPTTVPTADISYKEPEVLFSSFGRNPSPEMTGYFDSGRVSFLNSPSTGRLLEFSAIRKPGDPGRINRPGNTVWNTVIAQRESGDGGLTWGEWKVIFDPGVPHLPSLPFVLRSPDCNQLMLLCRDEYKTAHSWYITSDDEGRTWSDARQVNDNLTLDGHSAVYAADGRLVVLGKDDRSGSSTRYCTVAWVGRYEDIINQARGEYRIKVFRTYNAYFNAFSQGFPQASLMEDGRIEVRNALNRQGDRGLSIVKTIIDLNQIDDMLK